MKKKTQKQKQKQKTKQNKQTNKQTKLRPCIPMAQHRPWYYTYQLHDFTKDDIVCGLDNWVTGPAHSRFFVLFCFFVFWFVCLCFFLSDTNWKRILEHFEQFL